MDDLQEVFDGWLRSRVASDGSVTEGGYETDLEGMRSWRSDISEFALWLGANEPEMFDEFRVRYISLDPVGWDAIVGFGGGFHDKPAGPPDESQLESDVQSLVDTPVGDPTDGGFTGDPGQRVVAPPVSTTQPPRTTPVTSDTPPGVGPRHPGTWPVVPGQPIRPDGPERQSRPPERRPHERRPVPVEESARPGRHANVGAGWERHMGHPDAEAHHGYSVNNYGSLMPTREGFSKAGWDPVFGAAGAVAGGVKTGVGAAVGGVKTGLGAIGDFFSDSGSTDSGSTGRGDWPWPGGSVGMAIVENLGLSLNGKFLAVVMNDLFDRMNSAGRSPLSGYEQPSGSEGFPTVDENGQWMRPNAAPLASS